MRRSSGSNRLPPGSSRRARLVQVDGPKTQQQRQRRPPRGSARSRSSAARPKPVFRRFPAARAGSADAIPPLKAGSTLGIPSPPAVLLGSGRVATPTIEAVERFQGFPSGWTAVLRERFARHRWRLLGNAVSVPVAEWIGHRLAEPGCYDGVGDAALSQGRSWPGAAWNMDCRRDTRRVAVGVTEHPVRRRRGRISAFATERWPDLSKRALLGFTMRARMGRLKYPPGFLDVLESNLR